VVPYVVEGLLDAAGREVQVFSEHGVGLALYLDLNAIARDAAEHKLTVLRGALAALEQRSAAGKASNARS
jgi:hypothetical protein